MTADGVWYLARRRMLGAAIAANQAACGYVELLQSSRRECYEQDIAAMDIYRKPTEHDEKRYLENCQRLAGHMVEEYPESLFCPAAVLSAGHLSKEQRWQVWHLDQER